MGECAITLPKFHPKQELAFNSKATDLLFGGATRGGKSFFVRKAYIIWCSRIPGLMCDIFRLHFDDVVGNHMEGETSFPVLLAEWAKNGLVRINQTEIKFWNGSQISLEHCADDKVMMKHQGIARHVRTFEESTQILERRVRWLSAWVTMSEEMKSRVPDEWKGCFPRIIHTANPIGVSANYYRRNYVKARPRLQIERVGEFYRQYIPALVEDNPSEDAAATRRRVGEMGDEAVSEALLNENWDVQVGEFFPEWDEARHVVPDFEPPAHWSRYRAFDWGNAEPAAVYWLAVSDGESFEARYQGVRDGSLTWVTKHLWFPRGAVIAYREWYLCNPEKPAEGLRMRNEDIAKGIVARSPQPYEQNLETLSDSYPFPDRGEGKTIAQTFAENGVPLTLGKTSRVTGWSQMRARLIGKEFETGKRIAMLFICESCRYARDYIPALPRHPNEAKKEDAAEHGEATHSCDALRLACMAQEIIRDAEPPEPDTKKLSNEITFQAAMKLAKELRAHRDGPRY